MCGFRTDFTLCFYFSEQNISQDPQKCSITVARYCDLLQQYVIPAFRERQCSEITAFMDNVTPPHIAQQMTALLRTYFGDERDISSGFSTA